MQRVAQESSAKLREAGTPATSDSLHVAKLEAVPKWNLGDLKYFTQILIQCQVDLEELSSYREKETQMLRELQSNMLKGKVSNDIFLH